MGKKVTNRLKELQAIMSNVKAHADNPFSNVNYGMAKGEVPLKRTLNDAGDNLRKR